ncbi:hypothetical protein NA57DRAFT_33196 [Rhizodiscina lignyota]|uniref:Uncharacterized protein n=1 Tax=Rhizodiscina lignyota TaxID=1504668 RepID=A0A9P4IN89_9PEZI|nr:hypothetical protein NA57DRAFT_33196 [Rhizodiscina lignyota]
MSVEALQAQLHQLEAQRDAYLEIFNRTHAAVRDTLAQAGEAQGRGTRQSLELPASPASPTLQAPFPALSVSPPPLSRKHSNIGGHRYGDSNPAFSTYDASTLTDDSESDEDELFYVRQHLPTQSFDHEHLREHLKSYKFDWHGRQILANVVNDKGRLKNPSLFPAHGDTVEDKKNYSHYQVFDIGTDGVPVVVTTSSDFDKNAPRAKQIWLAIKDINASLKDDDDHAVGRITIAREPSPILFGALHLTYNSMFDMDELFRHLVESEASSVHLYRAFDDDERRRRSFVFNFEYYTIIGDERQPMAWQLADLNTAVSESHLPLSRCSSVVALTLYGNPIKKIRNSARRAKKRDGSIYDPWGAWQVINIQCYPDWKAKTDVHEASKRYVNGPEAFLFTVLGEFKDAQKRFEEIYRQISKLITPPLDFIFNEDARNRRLFEDKDFTYTRRYFWAHQTLGTMNDAIQAMIDAYEDNFTEELWDGRHKTLWPLSDSDQSGRNEYWKKRLRNLKMAFTREIASLRTLQKENNDRRAEIRFLRDQLFSGTSVMESRKSVELSEITIQQGRNIKVLTLVNIFFLPLTFVTSVYGKSTKQLKY